MVCRLGSASETGETLSCRIDTCILGYMGNFAGQLRIASICGLEVLHAASGGEHKIQARLRKSSHTLSCCRAATALRVVRC